MMESIKYEDVIDWLLSHPNTYTWGENRQRLDAAIEHKIGGLDSYAGTCIILGYAHKTPCWPTPIELVAVAMGSVEEDGGRWSNPPQQDALDAAEACLDALKIAYVPPEEVKVSVEVRINDWCRLFQPVRLVAGARLTKRGRDPRYLDEPRFRVAALMRTIYKDKGKADTAARKIVTAALEDVHGPNPFASVAIVLAGIEEMPEHKTDLYARVCQAIEFEGVFDTDVFDVRIRRSQLAALGALVLTGYPVRGAVAEVNSDLDDVGLLDSAPET